MIEMYRPAVMQDPERRFFGMPLQVSYLDGREWAVARDVSYRLASGRFAGRVSTVRQGFVFDFASIPRALWRIFPPAGDGRNLYGLAAVWHDWLYAHRRIEGIPITRREVDGVFRELMLYLGVRPWVARIMWAAVRTAGWLPWNARRQEDIIP